MGIGWLGILALALLVWQQQAPLPLQFALWAFGLVAVTIGMGRVRWQRPNIKRRHALMLLALTGFALAVRGWQLQNGMRVLLDEGISIGVLLQMWDGPVGLLRRMEPRFAPYTGVYYALQNAFVALLGTDLTGLRAVSVVMGTLTVPALYLLALTLTDDHHTALLAGAALAALPLAVHFSRIGILSIGDPLAGTLAFAFLARGWKHTSRADWVAGGVCLGLTQYFFEGGRRFFAPMALLWLGWCALQNPRQARQNARWMLLALVGWLAAALPVFITWRLTEDLSVSRLASSGLNRAVFADILLSDVSDVAFWNYLRSIGRAYGVLFLIPESSEFYGGDWPFLLPFVAPFALLGLWHPLRRWRRMAVLPLLWVLAVPAANGLLLANPNGSPRYLIVLPALALLVAYGVRMLSRQRVVVAWAVMGLLVAGQVIYYYGAHMPNFTQQELSGDLDDALFRAAELPPNVPVLIVSPIERDAQYAQQVLRFLNGGTAAPDVITFSTREFVGAAYLTPALPDGPLAVFALTDDSAAHAAIAARYDPAGDTLNPYEVRFRLYRIGF